MIHDLSATHALRVAAVLVVWFSLLVAIVLTDGDPDVRCEADTEETP